jgi:hypothetical protein
VGCQVVDGGGTGTGLVTVPQISGRSQKLRGTVLISHSQSGTYPFQTAALSTKGVAGIIAIDTHAKPWLPQQA